MPQHDKIVPLHRGASIYSDPRSGFTVFTNAPARATGEAPATPTASPVNLYDTLKVREPSLFDILCDALADLVVDIASMPGTSLALIVFGQFTVVASVIAWTLLS